MTGSEGHLMDNRLVRSGTLLWGVLWVWLAIVAQAHQPPPASGSAPLGDSVQRAIGQFNAAAALLEQYAYADAAKRLEQVLAAAPAWSAARFNLGLAYLNMQEEAGAKENLERARAAFESVLKDDPNHLHARFGLGLLYQHTGENAKAAECFLRIHKADPADPHAAYKVAEALIALEDKAQALGLLEAILQRDPGFVSGIYRLAGLYQRGGQPEKAAGLFARFRELKESELTGGSFAVLNAYGTVGKYYMALGADSLPVKSPTKVQQRIVFSPEVRSLPFQASAWRAGGLDVRLAGLAVGDVDGDGDLDLCVTGVNQEGGASIWINDGSGVFSAGQVLARHAVCPALGDVDNDGSLDLWLGCAETDLLLANDGKGHFHEVDLAGITGRRGGTRMARLLDVDSDGDLDLLAFHLKKGTVPAVGTAQTQPATCYNNNRDGSFVDVAEKLGLTSAAAVAAWICDDFDNDRDMDMLLFPQGQQPVGWVNERAGRHHTLDSSAMGLPRLANVLGATTGDVNADGIRDLLVFTTGPACLFLGRGGFRFSQDPSFTGRAGQLGASGGQFADMDNDGDLDILVADALRPNGKRGPVLLINEWPKIGFVRAEQVDPGNLLQTLSFKGYASGVVADFTGDGRQDVLLVPQGAAALLAVNATQGGHWIEIDLQGIQGQDGKSRSNNSAIGARIDVKTGLTSQQHLVGAVSGPVASPPQRVHVGLGEKSTVDWLRITWPDAVLQAELELPADRVTKIPELQRKVSSCPHLFAWNGTRYEFVADFGGMGGLGYLTGPDAYSPPDVSEYVPIPRLESIGGEYVLQVVEPLEEAVYLDEVELLAVDHPVGTEVYPNEMMAVSAPPPEFELFCIKESIDPVSAVDHQGRDVTDAVRRIDRVCAGPSQSDPRFVGYAKDHFVELDFGDRLGRQAAGSRLVLILGGWVDYSYCSTNYAAAQAGLRIQAPSIQVYREDRWVELFHEVGYPAGLNHVMTLEVTGKLRQTDRRIRIASNMELYWDWLTLARLLPDAAVQSRSIEAAGADLHFFGYPREYSPDGRQPNLYDYSQVDRAVPWKQMRGAYTRYGDVTDLVRRSDDRYVIMGPGEEVTLRFPASRLGPVSPGCVRSFILKTASYCKDMDLYTAYPDTVEPLPFRGMKGYPYGPDQAYPEDVVHREYQKTFNTRILR